MFGRLFYKGHCTTFPETWHMHFNRLRGLRASSMCYTIATIFAIFMAILPCNTATTFDQIVSIGQYTISFNYMINAWEVKFDDVQLQNALVIPQLCTADPTLDPTLSTCVQDDVTSVVTCAQLQALVNTEAWESTSLLQNANTLCSTSSLPNQQKAVAQTHDWVYVTSPLQIVIPFKQDLLTRYSVVGENSYTMHVRLVMLDISTLESGIASVNTLHMTYVLNKPTGLASETLLQNVCEQRGLQTPRNGLLFVGVGEHEQDICMARCNWQYLRVPWNAAVPLQTATHLQETSICLRIPHEFTATIVHVNLNISRTATASLLPQYTLDAVDELAGAMIDSQNQSAETSVSIVVCRVPGSYTQGQHFEFILQKFVNEAADTSMAYEIREKPLASIDEDVYAECLIIATELMEAPEAARRAQKLVQSTTDSFQNPNLVLGDFDVKRVSRLARTKITHQPRVSVDLQRIVIISVQVVLVMWIVITLYNKRGMGFRS